MDLIPMCRTTEPHLLLHSSSISFASSYATSVPPTSPFLLALSMAHSRHRLSLTSLYATSVASNFTLSSSTTDGCSFTSFTPLSLFDNHPSPASSYATLVASSNSPFPLAPPIAHSRDRLSSTTICLPSLSPASLSPLPLRMRLW
jgi:hypothetical protein